MTKTALGDIHNFGPAVTHSENGTMLRKSRTSYWEESFLTNSSFRRYVNELFMAEGFVSPLAFFPNLRFEQKTNCYDVECVKTSPITLSSSYLESVGGFVFLASWLGLTDLHYKNVALGSDDGVPQIVPWDIEIVGARVILPSQTNLISKSTEVKHTSGLSPLKTIISNDSKHKSDLLRGYENAGRVIGLSGDQIWQKLFQTKNSMNTPIRVVLKDTAVYEEMINSGVYEGLCDEELFQVERGFIPYFYTTMSSGEVFFYKDSKPTKARINLNDTNQGLRQSPPTSDDLERLSHFGLMQLNKWLGKNIPMN